MKTKTHTATGQDLLKQLIELFGTLGGVAVGLAYLLFEQAMIDPAQFTYIVCAAVIGEGIGGGLRIIGGKVEDTAKALKTDTIRRCDCGK